MTLYKSGDYAAFQCLFERHSGRVYQYLKGKVSSESACDLLQETFLKVHRSRETYQSQYPFLPWLFTVARNSLHDFLKSSDQKVVKVEFDLLSLSSPSPAESGHDLSSALASLPIGQRHAIEMRYLNDWSFEMIAENMRTTPENSRQIVSRGLRKLRSVLKGGGR